MKSRYDVVLDLNKKNSSHTLIYDLVKESAGDRSFESLRLLDIGCSEGRLSEAFSSLGIYVCGVEPFCENDETAGRMAEFFNGNIEDFLAEKAAFIEPFDFIVMGDVLEHIPNPGKLLLELSKILKPDGRFVVSIHNITHCDILSMLSDGQFRYSNLGILDKTHVNFFSQWSIRDLFIQCGFGIENMEKVFIPRSFEYPLSLLPSDSAGSHANSEVYQFVIAASRQALHSTLFASSPPKRILIITSCLEGSCFEFRLKIPYTLYADKYNAEIRYRSFYDIRDLYWADVLVVQRELSVDALKAIKQAFRMGLPFVFEIDDMLYNLPDNLAVAYPPAYKQSIKRILSFADCVSTSTGQFSKDILKYAGKVKKIRNIFPGEALDPEKRHDDDKDITLLLCSSDKLINKVGYKLFEKVAKLRPEIKLMLVGDYIIEDAVDYDFTAETFPIMPADSFSSLLKSKNNLIGIIPLDDSVFSSCKSEIKFLYYSICAVPGIFSNVSPYADVVENGVSGILVDDDLEEWYRKTMELADSREKRIELVKNAQKIAAELYNSDIVLAELEEMLFELPIPDKRGFGQDKTCVLNRLTSMKWKIKNVFSRFIERIYMKIMRIMN